MFETISRKDKINKMQCVPLNCHLWSEFDFHELTESMRQKDDSIFFDMKNRIRIGSPSDSDIELLKKNVKSN